ncbi:hypothetical protein ACVIGB_000837 [Bradyrhizobium sp. USDA 4341]
MVALEKLMAAVGTQNRSSKGGNGSFGPWINPMVEFVSAEMAGGPDKDVFVIKHLVDQPEVGKRAGDQDKMKLRDLKPTQATLEDHLKGKNKVKKATPGTVYVAKRAFRDKDGVLSVDWVDRVAPSMEDEEIYPATGVMVKPYSLYYDRETGKLKGGDTVVADLWRAVRVKGDKAVEGNEVVLSYDDMINGEKMAAVGYGPKSASFEDAVRAMFQPTWGGAPGFMIRAWDNNSPNSPPSVIRDVRYRDSVKNPDGEGYIEQTHEQAIEAFLADMGPIFANAENFPPGVTVEIVPNRTYALVGETRQKLAAEMKTRNARHDREADPFYAPVLEAGRDKESSKACWCEANLVVWRKFNDEKQKEVFFRTSLSPRRCAPEHHYTDAEVVTENMPASYAAVLTASAGKRSEALREAKKSKAAPAQTADTNSVGEDPGLENEAAMRAGA